MVVIQQRASPFDELPMIDERLTQGQQFEQRCFGKHSKEGKLPYLTERDALAFATMKQGTWLPSAPSTPFGRGLLKALRQIIDNQLAKNSSKTNPPRRYTLRLYVAIGTPLDQHHGVDAYVSLEDQEFAHDFIATLDVTLNTMKIHGGTPSKAQIVFGRPEVEALEQFDQDEGFTDFPGQVLDIFDILWAGWYQFIQALKVTNV